MELQTKYTVYRLYDATDDLLYVGCTKHLTYRLERHSKTAVWWPDVARVEQTDFDDPIKAADIEEHYHLTEAPRHNGERHTRYRLSYARRPPTEQGAVKRVRALPQVDPRKLKRARFRAGLTQQELADNAGTTQTTVARIERDAVEPEVTTVRKLAAALGVSISDLLD